MTDQPTTNPTATPEPTVDATEDNNRRPEIIAAMLEVRRVRERIRSEYREVQAGFKAKLRLLDATLAGLFDCLDEAESGQLNLFDVDFAMPPDVERLLKNE